MIVELVARTQLVPGALEKLGYIPHEPGTVSHGDELHEAAGRECYQSWRRPNKPTATNPGYLGNIISKRHFSTMEHTNLTFSIREVSRALTHELIRHRMLSPSQVSQRYVDESQGQMIIPPELARSNDALWDLLLTDEHHEMIQIYNRIYDVLVAGGVPKKRARQAARYVLPNGHSTRLLITGNVRAWREVVEKRIARDPDTGEPLADLEINELATRILAILHQEVPNSVQDLWETYGPLDKAAEATPEHTPCVDAPAVVG